MPSTYYYLPTRNVFGAGSVSEAGQLMESLGGTNAMIVTDSSIATSPITAKIQTFLDASGICSCVFGGAEPNPKDINVAEGLKFYRANHCDCIISLGGGSSHDCAKAIALVSTNGGTIRDYEGVNRLHTTTPPMLAINTTAGTASEITRFCIITDTSRKAKMCIVDWRLTPDVAINDPELHRGMPAHLTAATGMDALTNAIEAYVSTDANPLTDAAALKAIQMIGHYLPKAVANGDYMNARENMAYAQYLAGIAFNNASLGYVHAMAHQLGGFYDLSHGVCNALLLPYVMRFNIIGNYDRILTIGKAMEIGEHSSFATFEDQAMNVIAGVKRFAEFVGIPSSLRELGVNPDDFEAMAVNAMKDACALTNPRKATLSDIITIYQQAYDGEL